MSTPKISLLSVKPSPIVTEGGPILTGHPFRIYPNAPNADKSVDVRLSQFSKVFYDLTYNTNLPIYGLDLTLTIRYGDKIWLEIYYNADLTAQFGIVKTGRKWPALTANPDNVSQTTKVYPKQLELILRQDLSTKLLDMDATIQVLEDYRSKALQILSFRKNSGVYRDDAEYNALVDRANVEYARIRQLMRDYKASLAQFFTNAPAGNWRKLFRTYTIIGYTTKNLNSNLDGFIVRPKQPPTPTPSIPVATASDDFKIVQSVNTDLLLTEICYDNRYPAVIPIPYVRAVNEHYVNGQAEELTIINE